MKSINYNSHYKILVIQLDPFGDVLLTTAYFEALKNKFPNSKLYYLVKEPYHKIILDHPHIEEIITTKNFTGLRYFIERIKLISKIRNEKFDLIIDQQNKPSTKQIILFSGAKYKVGYEHSRFDFVYNIKSTRNHIKRYSPIMRFDILEKLGINYEKFDLFFYVDKLSEDTISKWLEFKNINDFIVISPGSPVIRKMWSLLRYAELTDLIQKELSIKVVFAWGPNEEDMIQKITKMMNTEAIVGPPTNLQQLGALIKKSKLLICNDGGVNHLSAAIRTPTLAIFGPTSSEVWSPASVLSSHHHINGNMNERINNDFGLSALEVFREIKSILNNLK